MFSSKIAFRYLRNQKCLSKSAAARIFLNQWLSGHHFVFLVGLFHCYDIAIVCKLDYVIQTVYPRINMVQNSFCSHSFNQFKYVRQVAYWSKLVLIFQDQGLVPFSRYWDWVEFTGGCLEFTYDFLNLLTCCRSRVSNGVDKSNYSGSGRQQMVDGAGWREIFEWGISYLFHFILLKTIRDDKTLHSWYMW